MSLQVESFPSCCGIKVISGFGKTKTSLQSNKDNVSDVSKELSSIISKYSRSSYYSVGLLMITLNEDQVPLYQDEILNLGFFIAQRAFYHPGHGKFITVYNKVLQENKSYGKGSVKAFTSDKVITEFEKKFGESVPASKPVVARRRKVE